MRLLRAVSLTCAILWPTAAQAQLPDLVETAAGNPPANAQLGSTLGTSDTAQNQGSAVAVPSTTRYYLSLNTTKDSGDVLLSGGRAVPELSSGNASAGVSSVTVPFTSAPGAYYLLACADDLQTVNESNETNNCAASTFQMVLESGDTLLENQWHLKSRTLEVAGANVRGAWGSAVGSGVVIGVVDDGLQHTHPDLQPNYIPTLSFDFNQNDADPSPFVSGDCDVSNCHGTSVAGVAAARGGNGIGASGAARVASLAGLRLISAPTSDAQEAAALGHQPQAIHILNNSWGPPDDGFTLRGPGPMTEAAIQTGATQGRGGRGRVLLWAAGNGAQYFDNCNFDGFANNRFVIAVGALADTGQQAYYSEPCAALFVTAPSSGGTRGVTTTDLVGSDGYSFPFFNDYTSTFGGTSSAAPLVSGIVALMLQANPSLTSRDVQHILVRTSHRINPADPSWTAARYPHSEKFGFGLVDAAAAVAQAGSWRTVLSERAIPPVTHTLKFPIPDNNAAGRVDSIMIAPGFGNFRVERVEVVFTATHPWRGDLEVTLTSPTGVVSHLATERPFDSNDNFSAWRFSSARHWGESAAGTWTLRVADVEALLTGTWQSWTLRIYGTQPTAPAGTRPTTDFDGDGRNDFTIYRAGAWQIQNGPPKQWGFASDVPVPGDYNGDGYAEAAVFRPSEGVWYIEGQAPIFWGWSADLAVPADYDGDGRTDIAVFRPGNGTWYVRGLPEVQFGLAGDIPVPGDYTGDGRADLAVYRPSEAAWYILGLGRFQFGLLADVPVPADYNGDGRIDIAVWRPSSGEWFVRNQFSIQWGLPADVPLGLDVNADGRSELVVYRRESGTWFSLDPLTGANSTMQQGGSGSVPALTRPWLTATVVGDMEGDRRADVTVFRPSIAEWFSRTSSTAFAGQLAQQLGSAGDIAVPGDYRGIGRTQPATYRPDDGTWRIAGGPTIQWGIAGDQPVPGDYDGDNRTDVSVWRPSTGIWYLLYSSTEWQGAQAFQWGLPGDLPVPGDYDGDRRTDLAVFRPSTAVWYILLSSTNFTAPWVVQWGLLADKPVPGDYDGDNRTDIAVWRPANGTWFTLLSSTNYGSYTAVQWGLPGDTLVPADFDGDGRTDAAVFRPSSATWYARFQFLGLQWGLVGDIPLPKIP